MRPMSLLVLLHAAPAWAKDVQFVYFQEQGEPYNAAHVADLEQHAYALQAFFLQELGVTFELATPVVAHVSGLHDSLWYLTTPDGIHSDPRWYRLGNLKTEVYAALGLVDFDPERRVVVYPTTRIDGHVGANFGGAWMDGDDLSCIASNGETYPYPDLTPAHCLGHMAHEVGHVFGLSHTGPADDCMRWGFYDTTGGARMCFFDDANRQSVRDFDAARGWLTLGGGVSCGDQDASCAVLAAAGSCPTDPALRDLCEASCEVCWGDVCRDEHPSCAAWAAAGECAANPGYMLPTCGVSCGVCTEDCDDADQDRVCDAYDQCEGNDALGDADLDGWCEPLLMVEGLTAGGAATLTVRGARPGSAVVFLASATGASAAPQCHPAAPVCTRLQGRRVLGAAVADAAGQASWEQPIPAGLAGRALWFQGAWVQGAAGEISAVVQGLVAP